MTGRRAVGAVAVALIGVGGYALVATFARSSPFLVALYAAGFLLLSDGVVMPVVAASGWVLTRWLPPAVRGPVRVGLAVLAIVTLVALPTLLSPARGSDNATLLRQPYGHHLLAVWALVAAGTAIAATVSVLTRRRRPDPVGAPLRTAGHVDGAGEESGRL